MVFKKKYSKKVIFLDRDGVINHEIGYIKEWKKIKFYKNTLNALKKINKLGYLIIIITNQSIVARGIASKKEIINLNKKMMDYFKKKKIEIKHIYFCPHHPKFTINCSCRKPKNGMIIKAKKKYNLNLKQSWLVGDKTSDIKAGKISKIRTILVKTGYGGLDKKYKVKPDFICKNLNNAVNKVLKKNEIHS